MEHTMHLKGLVTGGPPEGSGRTPEGGMYDYDSDYSQCL